MCSPNKDRLREGVLWDLEECEGVVFFVRDEGGCKSRWVFEWYFLERLLRVLAAWTLKHGHFLIMGGFHLVEPIEGNSTSLETVTGTVDHGVVNVQSGPSSAEGTNPDAERGPASGNSHKPKEGRVTILTLEMLEVLAKDPEFEIPVTEDRITDRSKGDALSKTIFMLQSSWFMLQCLTRRIQGLNISQLELTKLALASLNGITFIFWWDKPLGAQTPVRVHLKRKLTDAERNVEGVSDFLIGASTFFFDQQIARSICSINAGFQPPKNL